MSAAQKKNDLVDVIACLASSPEFADYDDARRASILQTLTTLLSESIAEQQKSVPG